MFLLEPAQTPYDLRWRMFGVPVRVHPMFWLVSVIFGWDLVDTKLGVTALLIWVAVCFVSILLHEFGHIWMGQLFGSFGHIVLYSFGGLAIGSRDVPWRWQRILVSFAGPGIQLLLWGGLWALVRSPWSPLSPGLNPILLLTLILLIEVNLFWPLLNLLPIWPLDGGQITREVCEGGLGSSRGVVVSLWISLVVSAFLAIHGLLAQLTRGRNPTLSPALLENLYFPIPYLPTSIWAIIFFALFAFSSYEALRAEQSRGQRWDDDLPWER
jgi:Zn-dependent protease